MNFNYINLNQININKLFNIGRKYHVSFSADDIVFISFLYNKSKEKNKFAISKCIINEREYFKIDENDINRLGLYHNFDLIYSNNSATIIMDNFVKAGLIDLVIERYQNNEDIYFSFNDEIMYKILNK